MWICKNCQHRMGDIFSDCLRCGYTKEGDPPTDDSQNDDGWAKHWMHRKKPWRLRSAAFIIDYVIYAAAWAVIDNLIYFPIPYFLIMIGSVLFFCAYFAYFEGKGKINQSLGKKWLGLELVSTDGGHLSTMTVFKRSAIVAAMIVFDFHWLATLLQMPAFAAGLGWSIPSGLVVYNAWLAIKHPDGLMLQDRYTGTRVVRTSTKAQMAPTPALGVVKGIVKFPRPGVAVACVLALSIITLAGSYGVHSLLGSESIWEFPGVEGTDVVAIMEQSVADEMGVRCHVYLWANRNVTYGGSDVRTLMVSIWIPALMWNEGTIEEVSKVALKPLEISPGYYDRGQLRVWTGFEYIDVVRTFNLKLP